MPSSPPPPAAPKLLESDDEDILQATPQSQPKVDITNNSKKSKKRVAVNKTFMDEDGFLSE